MVDGKSIAYFVMKKQIRFRMSYPPTAIRDPLS